MPLSQQIKPISYLKAHAADIARTLHEKGEPLIITQNGEAKLVVQDVASYEQTQEALALIRILAFEKDQHEQGKSRPALEAIKELRKKYQER